MKILLLKYTALGWKDLYQTLIALGHEVSCMDYTPKSFEEDPIMEEYFMNLLSKETYDVLISFNYFQVIAKVCYHYNMNYLAWVWDSPLLTLYSPTIKFSTNYIFIFDRVLKEKLKIKNIDTIYHLPLAVNHRRLEQIIIDEEDEIKYKSDISFVGRMYTNKLSYDSLTTIPDYYRGYLEAIIKAQTKIQGYNFLEEVISDEIVNGICSRTEFYLGDKFTGSLKNVIADVFLGTKVTQLERMETLRCLASYYKINLYTDEIIEMIPGVECKGGIDYYDQMPKVFRLSKINLNITHRTIQSGIPLRVFDIMGAGGFVLSNYQPELTDLFTEGEELAIYYNLDDLIRKVTYYLAHEEERRRIAEAGCKKVRTMHNYEIRLKQMLETVTEEAKRGRGLQ